MSLLIAVGFTGCVVVVPDVPVIQVRHVSHSVSYVYDNDYYDSYPIYRYNRVKYVKRNGHYYTLSNYNRTYRRHHVVKPVVVIKTNRHHKKKHKRIKRKHKIRQTHIYRY